jgi:plasmid stability protein
MMLVGSRLDGTNRARATHKISYERFVGPIPDGHCVMHRCDQRNCVRPSHLTTGTVADNNRDRDAKGRHVALRGDAHPSRMHPEMYPRGAEHHRAKLTEDGVRDIRRRMLGGERQKDVAALYCVDKATVRNIMIGKVWKHVA